LIFKTFSCLVVVRNNYKDLLASKILLTSFKIPLGNINKEFRVRKVITKNYNNKQQKTIKNSDKHMNTDNIDLPYYSIECSFKGLGHEIEFKYFELLVDI
jgi:hypothetical protein